VLPRSLRYAYKLQNVNANLLVYIFVPKL
jgi:hypothetical protein